MSIRGKWAVFGTLGVALLVCVWWGFSPRNGHIEDRTAYPPARGEDGGDEVIPAADRTPATADPGAIRVGVLFWSMSIEGQVAMRRGLEAEGDRLSRDAAATGGRRVLLESHVAGDGEQGIETQIRQMRELIAERVDLIIVQPTDNAALAAPLRDANAAGIPVVAYDQYIDGGDLAAYVTSDNY